MPTATPGECMYIVQVLAYNIKRREDEKDEKDWRPRREQSEIIKHMELI